MKFKEEYAKLNDAQREAVDAIDGPVMVVAGPGTGKTQILTLRIANILAKTDTPPEAILALTFTEKAAANMRQRLSAIIGSAAYRVRIKTFHGFCNDVIQTFPEQFPHIVGSTPLSEAEQVGILEGIIDTAQLKELRPFGNRFTWLKAIKFAINDLKREGADPEQFAKMVTAEEKAFAAIDDLYNESGRYKGKMKGKYVTLQDSINRNKELVDVYKHYQKALADSHAYDYSDMIMEVMRALEKNETLLRVLQEEHLYLLVDEHQDTNKAQNRILELLADFYDNPNLFAVGDEKQAIFRFQGASLENFRYFQKRWPSAKLIYLEENYRSGQAILDIAEGIRPGAKPLKAQAKAGEKAISVLALSSPAVEEYFIATHIKERLSAGTKAEEIVVLYRNNADALPLARILEKSGIPFAIESDQSVLADDDMRKFLLVLAALRHFGDPVYLYPILYLDFLGIEPLEAYKLTAVAENRQTNPYDLMRKSDSPTLNELYAKLSRLKTLVAGRGAVSAFDEVVRETGFLSYLLGKPDAAEKLAKLNVLFDQVKAVVEKRKDAGLDEFMAFLDTVREHQLSLDAAGLGHAPGAVRLMTTHKAKGLEFDYVYITGAVHGHWDGAKGGGPKLKLPRSVGALLEKIEDEFTESEDEDERNLFYVALTRARKEIYITYAQTRTDGKEQHLSKFILEMREDLVHRPDTPPYESGYTSNRELAFAPPVVARSAITDKEYLNELFRAQAMSATALNNYLECPWKYFFLNLVRIREASNKHLMFGNSVHAALKIFFDKLKAGEPADKDLLVSQFVLALNRQPMEKKDYPDALEKGQMALSGWYDEYHQSWRTNTLTEFRIETIELTPEIRITGNLDKVEILDDAGNVNVVDYKSGKTKSRNEIEGTRPGDAGDPSAGAYKRQLVFYQLLLNKYADGKFKMQSAEIDFIEPNDSGKFKKEKFAITPADVSTLESLILSTAQEILDLSFWQKSCNEPDCRYCDLRKMMKT